MRNAIYLFLAIFLSLSCINPTHAEYDLTEEDYYLQTTGLAPLDLIINNLKEISNVILLEDPGQSEVIRAITILRSNRKTIRMVDELSKNSKRIFAKRFKRLINLVQMGKYELARNIVEEQLASLRELKDAPF